MDNLIVQASTYHYDMRHFGKYLDCTHGESGACYSNVFLFADFYKKVGREFDVVLTFGGRSWDNANVFGYHYVLRDTETREYIDPQYSRSTLLPVHEWTLAEYRKEFDEFVKDTGEIPTGDFAAFYGDFHRQYVEAGCLMLRAMARHKPPSKRCITQMLQECSGQGRIPMYGRSLVRKVMFD